MKRLAPLLNVFLLVFLAFSLVNSVAADEGATREECVAKTKQIVKLIEEAGLETALEKMNDLQGPFFWKDSYVFSFEDETGKILAHKNPALIGFEAKDLRDVNGKPYFRKMFHVANTKGEGFVTYMYQKEPGGAPEPKTSYIIKVPGKNIIVGAGFFE